MRRAGLFVGALWLVACGDRAGGVFFDGGADGAAFFRVVEVTPPAEADAGMFSPSANFLAVAGSSATNVVMVGSGGAIARWNGRTLTAETSGTQAELRGLAVPSADIAWAVGENGTVLRWNSNGWTPQTSGASALLNAVWSDGNNMIAVGAKGAAVGFDVKWHSIATDSPDDLYAISASPQGLFAVGTLGTFARYDGVKFHRMAVPGYSKTLAGATTGPGGSYAVGLAGAVYRYDGSLSAVMKVPPVFLRGVSAPGPDVFVVGFDALIARLRGTDVQLYGNVPARSWYGVWAASNADVWVVGASGTVLHSNPAAFSAPDGGLIDAAAGGGD